MWMTSTLAGLDRTGSTGSVTHVVVCLELSRIGMRDESDEIDLTLYI